MAASETESRFARALVDALHEKQRPKSNHPDNAAYPVEERGVLFIREDQVDGAGRPGPGAAVEGAWKQMNRFKRLCDRLTRHAVRETYGDSALEFGEARLRLR
jgi:hypothetical protein